ncbi:IS110 family transposase [Glutamicibacter halophytocola]|uniref:IS110 family transposase n=1 Tax=Glutamicibacter halophytocola TaxID=1933880 RepID=A0AA94XUS2_9MICC|nr:IS110 family transposase [Glutamicibacter halophytocola]UUX60379.1 IS110 family transposase [Glutamicibacter halophytocola]
MTIVVEAYDFVIGIDTHARTHTYAIINTCTGARIGCETFPVTNNGMNRAVSWISRNTHDQTLAAVEGTNSYGSSIRRTLAKANIDVAEVKPPRKRTRYGVGKTDQIDATAAAMSALGTELTSLLHPRDDGARAAISVLLAARRRVEEQCTADRNALNALVRQIDLGLDSRKALTDAQITDISNWRLRESDNVEQRIARAEAVDLAKSIQIFHTRSKEIKSELAILDEQLAPRMQSQLGMGPVTVGIILAAYSHPGRIRSEAAFAALAGVAPLEASSGNTKRHRLNRGGDRQLNMALDIIIKTRMRLDEATKAYVERRTAEGRTYREIKRSLKRYLARSIFRQLERLMS